MATYFGPEKPTPFCVLSEQNLRKSLNHLLNENINGNKTKSRYINDLNKTHQENQFYHLVNKYFDIDCDDDILFFRPFDDVRKESASYDSFQNWPLLIEQKFSLLKPLDICEIKLKEHYIPNHARINETLFDFEFKNKANVNKKYDKIIIKNCLKYFDQDQKYFCEFITTFLKDHLPAKPTILILQRVNNLSTLPFHKTIYDEWAASDADYFQFIETMKHSHFTVRFNIENFKYIIDSKSSWYNNLKEKSIYPLNQCSLISPQSLDNNGLLNGIRELNEGYL
jgi:hypothetical protein